MITPVRILKKGNTLIRWRKYMVLFLPLVFSCVDPYWPNLEGEGEKLVVDALVTDDPDNQYVRLSFSTPANEQDFESVSGATVVVTDDLGDAVFFYENESGNYYPENFAGVDGRRYSLSITLPDGRQYESGFQPLTVSESFDSIYYVIENQSTTDPRYDIEGARFYINDIPSGPQEQYFLYKLTETYKFHVDFTLEYIEAGSGLTRILDPPSTLCYKTEGVYGFYIFKSKANIDPHTQTLPLNFVTFETKKFYERYCLQVKQISVSEEVFNLYYRVSQQNNSGSLYTIQPYNIIGNVKCVTDDKETVLGSFVVGGIREKREFFNRPAHVNFTFTACFGQTDGIGYLIRRGGKPSNPLLFTFIDGALALGQPQCFLCSENGATNDRPDFWED